MKAALNNIVLFALMALNVLSSAMLALPKLLYHRESEHLDRFLILMPIGLVGTLIWCAINVHANPSLVRFVLILVSIGFAITFFGLCSGTVVQ